MFQNVHVQTLGGLMPELTMFVNACGFGFEHGLIKNSPVLQEMQYFYQQTVAAKKTEANVFIYNSAI